MSTRKTAGGVLLAAAGTSYTLSGKTAATTDPNGNVTRYAYDGDDRLSSVTDPAGSVTTFGYDALSRKVSTSNAAIQAAPLVSQTYTGDGLMGGLTDANGHTTAYAYDGFDRLSKATYPDATFESYVYDADSNVTTKTTRKGDTIGFSYDSLNRLITKTAPSEAAVTYAYDLAGRLTGVTDASSAIHAVSTQGSYAASYSYDATNRMITASWTPAPTQTPPSAGTVTFRACNWMNIRRLCLKRVVRVLASDPYRPQTTWARARRSETSCAAFLTEPKSGSL